MNILTGNLTLTHKSDVATDTVKLRFSLSDLKTLSGETHNKAFNFVPGQFVSIGFSATAWRAYSIASTPQENELELVIRLVEGGVGSEAFRAANIGDEFEFKGPFGHFQLSQNPKAHLVFCATGTGIAPFRAMVKAEQSANTPRNMTLLYGGKNADDLAYLNEANHWSADLNIQLGLSRDPDLHIPEGLKAQVEHCRITQLLENLDYTQDLEFYLCGNGSMVKSVQEILETKGVAKEKLFMERFN